MAPRTKPDAAAADEHVHHHKSGHRVPTEVPPFTVADLRRAIPKHCFERSYLISFAYLIVDLAIVAALFYAAGFIDKLITSDGMFGAAAPYVRYVLWTTYWIVQGCVMTGLWVIGHECGHGGFSDSEPLNDTVGFAVHSALLVPYFAWKISHRRHHSNTGSLERDEVFVPPTDDAFSDNPLLWSLPGRVFQIVITLTVGWFMYLGFNTTSRPYPGYKWVSHFHPTSPIFSDKERHLIVMSDFGLVAMVAMLTMIGNAYGFAWLLKMYLVPYFIVNFWLVLITLLHHTDLALPHYSNKEWDWLRGALATVDRDYGILNIVHHHIGDTHVAHHLFSSMPHYHAQEATEAIKPILKSYYHSDTNTSIATALWRAYKNCHFVTEEDKEGVYWFRSVEQYKKKANKSA